MLGHFRPAPISVRVSLLVLLSLLFAPAGLASGTEELLSRGRAELEAERYESAELLFRQALQQEASNGEATFLLGMALAKQERWADAERELERAVRLRPGDAAAHAELAGVYFKQDRRDKSRASLGTALKLDPKNSYARSFLAILSYLQDRRLEALHHWNLLGEPQIAQIEVAASEDAAPKLVDSLFRFNEGEVLDRGAAPAGVLGPDQVQAGTPVRMAARPAARGTLGSTCRPSSSQRLFFQQDRVPDRKFLPSRLQPGDRSRVAGRPGPAIGGRGSVGRPPETGRGIRLVSVFFRLLPTCCVLASMSGTRSGATPHRVRNMTTGRKRSSAATNG